MTLVIPNFSSSAIMRSKLLVYDQIPCKTNNITLYVSHPMPLLCVSCQLICLFYWQHSNIFIRYNTSDFVRDITISPGLISIAVPDGSKC